MIIRLDIYLTLMKEKKLYRFHSDATIENCQFKMSVCYKQREMTKLLSLERQYKVTWCS